MSRPGESVVLVRGSPSRKILDSSAAQSEREIQLDRGFTLVGDIPRTRGDDSEYPIYLDRTADAGSPKRALEAFVDTPCISMQTH